MFLKSLSPALLIFGFVSSAMAASPGMEAGTYKLRSGDRNMCSTIKLSKKDLEASRIEMTAHLTLIMKNSDSVLESDLDPSCEFRQHTSKEVVGNETVVTRKNAEFCKGKMQTDTVVKVSFRGAQILLEQRTTNSMGTLVENCEWQRQ